jgi:hypothetical protein
VRPLDSARAAIAGSLTTLLAIWVMATKTSEQQWATQDVVLAVATFLAVLMLMLGVDIRRRGGNGS